MWRSVYNLRYQNRFVGLQPGNPPKTNQPSAAKKIVDFDRVKDKDDDDKDLNFGLRTDIYGDKKGVKVSTVWRNIE